jgi:histidinol-phosphate/aromatic aminotransferase/cobyric acid decarboxylase-like protein
MTETVARISVGTAAEDDAAVAALEASIDVTAHA